MHRIEAYTTLAMILIAAICILYLPVLFILRKRGTGVLRQLSYLGLFCSVFLIVFATILFMPFTFKPEQYILNLIPFQWVREANPLRQFTVEVVPNILMFIPLGIFLPIVMIKMRRFHQAVLPIFSFTFSIELFQYFIGRSSDIDDILSNLLGGMIGFGMYKLLNHLLARKILWKRLTGERE